MHKTSGVPDQLIVLPRPTYLPLYTALVTAAAVLAMLFKFYLLSLAFALLTAGLFVFAGQSAGLARDYGPLPVGRGVSVPPHTEVADAPAWLALICALVADGTLFTSLLFGTFYLWIAAPNWTAAIRPEPNLMLAVGTLLALLLAAAAARGSLRAVTAGGRAGGWIGLAGLALLAAVATAVGQIAGVVPHPREHALGATAAALIFYVALHAGIGLLFLISNSLRLGAGFISTRRVLDMRLTRLWLDYTLVTGVIAMGLVLALPALVTMLGGGRERASGTIKAAMVARGGLHCLVQRIGYALRDPRYRLRVCLVVRLAAAVACRGSACASDRTGLDVARHRPCWPGLRFRPDRRVSALGRRRNAHYRACRHRAHFRPAATAHGVRVNGPTGTNHPWPGTRHRSVRFATPNAKLSPIWPSTDNGCSVIVRRDPPISTLAPRPRPRAMLPLAPT